MTGARVARVSVIPVMVGVLLIACNDRDPLVPSFAVAKGGLGAPSNLRLSVNSYHEIAFAWQDNANNESGFEVWRSTTGPTGSFTLLATYASPNTTSGANGGLQPSTQYCYKVRAYGTTGQSGKIGAYSGFSNTSCATTPAPPPPPPPPGPPAAPTLQSASAYPFVIMLSWWDNADNEDGFKIEQCVGETCAETDFNVILTVATSPYQPHSIQISGGMDGGIYQYRVRAFNGSGDSPPSNTQMVIGCIVEITDDGQYYCR